MSMGESEKTGESMRETLANSRSVTPTGKQAPLEEPGKIAWQRLWPILAAVATAGGLGIPFPEIAVIGSGFALLVALAWRNRESGGAGDRAAATACVSWSSRARRSSR